MRDCVTDFVQEISRARSFLYLYVSVHVGVRISVTGCAQHKYGMLCVIGWCGCVGVLEIR